MEPSARARGIAGTVAVVAVFAVLAATAEAVIVEGSGGREASIALRSGVAAEDVPGSLATGRGQRDTGGDVSYHGGPVLHGVTTYALYWDPGNAFTTTTKNLINQYFADVAHDSGTDDNNYAVLGEYSDGSGSIEYLQTFGGALADSNAYPASGCTHGAICLTDAQLRAQLNTFITANGLPKGMSTEYFVFTPPNVTTCFNTTSTCSDDTYCAYHSFTGSGSTTILYADQPFTLYVPATAKSCQFDGNSAIQEPNGDIADVVLKAVGHESRETISDPRLNAWFDAQGNELDDKCNSTGSGLGRDPRAFLPTLGGSAVAGTLFNQVFNGHNYYEQSEWSNLRGSCRMLPGSSPVAAFTATPTVVSPGSPVAFNAGGSSDSDGTINGYSWDFGDSSGAGSGLTTSHAYSAPGTYNVQLTVTDNDIDALTGSVSHQVIVTPPPPPPETSIGSHPKSRVKTKKKKAKVTFTFSAGGGGTSFQ
ncbi:MAG: PKD domain-containing protein, partial [Vicinamibacteria bacterium]